MNDVKTPELNQMTSADRLRAYELIVAGCSHNWSKNKMQVDKVKTALNALIPLTKTDPIFLAHLNSYVMKQAVASKDLRVLTTFANALNTADGTPFSEGSKYKKPNLRYVSSAAVQDLDPKLVLRLLEVANMKFSTPEYLGQSRHFPTALRTAITKYIRYRESNLGYLRGMRKAGMSRMMESLYRTMRLQPLDEAAAIIRYRQKAKKIVFGDSIFDFSKLEDLQIAEKIRAEKLRPLPVIGALPRKMSPVIAVAILEQCTGNEAVIFKSIFEDAGVLKNKEVAQLFADKIKTAKTALDRAETLSKTSSQEVKDLLKTARADVRKEQVGDIGKVFLHIDASPSMERSLEIAKSRGAIIAETVKNPQQNFRWGLFHNSGELLPLPEEFVEDAFAAILFGRTTQWSTNAFALYPQAREFGADIDVIISDGDHNVGNLESLIRTYHQENPAHPKPRAMVLIWVKNGQHAETVQRAYEANQIPVAIVTPESLTQSALVAQAIKTAMVGAVAIVDEIMNTDLLPLPEWYFTI